MNEQSDATAEAIPSEGKPSLRQRMAALKTRHKDLMAEYGGIALLTYLTIFAVVLVGFASAIKLGFNVEGADEQAGTWFSAWVATKVTQPARIVATIALTPVVAGLYHRVRGTEHRSPEERADEAEAPEASEA